MLLRPLHDLDQAPALLARERPALHDAYDVADVGFVALVVRFETRRLANDLAVGRVRYARLGHDDDRLVHLVRRDATLFDAARTASGRCRDFAVMLLHAAPPP